MNILQGIKKAGTGLLLLSSGTFAASPIASLLGISQPPVQNTVEIIKFFLIIGSIVIAIAILAIFGFGYIALTGWKDHRKIPKGIRLLLAFTLGVLVFSLSGLISMILPIPFLPIVLMTIVFWGTLRGISTAFFNNQVANLQVVEAIDAAKQLIEQVEPNAQNVEIIDSTADSKSWRVSLFSNNSKRKYEVLLNKQDGDVTSWKST
jgi:hypothetical protein